jgi:hypothetical protein
MRQAKQFKTGKQALNTICSLTKHIRKQHKMGHWRAKRAAFAVIHNPERWGNIEYIDGKKTWSNEGLDMLFDYWRS